MIHSVTKGKHGLVKVDPSPPQAWHATLMGERKGQLLEEVADEKKGISRHCL
jgi:hypothetical protein